MQPPIPFRDTHQLPIGPARIIGRSFTAQRIQQMTLARCAGLEKAACEVEHFDHRISSFPPHCVSRLSDGGATRFHETDQPPLTSTTMSQLTGTISDSIIGEVAKALNQPGAWVVGDVLEPIRPRLFRLERRLQGIQADILRTKSQPAPNEHASPEQLALALNQLEQNFVELSTRHNDTVQALSLIKNRSQAKTEAIQQTLNVLDDETRER